MAGLSPGAHGTRETIMERATAAVRMTDISKAFSGNQVLYGVDFEVLPGEVHALVGGNGAGKSTLMKILQGVHTADAGVIEIDGRVVALQSPRDARALGIGMIFQEFSLIPTLTVAQNVFLLAEPRSGGLIDDREAERRTTAIFEQMGERINPRARVGDLSTGYWQLTEIAKALAQDARVLIMDEPTSSLTAGESDALFALVGRLKAQGIAIIYISHRMDEIFRITDRITILRDGHWILTAPTADLTMEQVIDAIVGRAMESAFEWHERPVDRAGTPLLSVRGLSAGTRVHSVTFELYPGEILGIAGLMGSGRTELARALFGIDRIGAGEVLVRGRPVVIRSPDDAIAAGMALVPEDRRVQGLVLDHTVRDNLLLPLLERIDRAGIIDDRAGDRVVDRYIGGLRIKTASPLTPARLLSGGNQQKIVIGKWLAMEPDILIMDEPTAGVDIQAKTEILAIIRGLADAGKGVVVISSEPAELLAVSDRVLVMRDGRLVHSVERREIDGEEELHRVVQGA
jgi:ribose transport system ATP-binding protein